MVSKLTKRALAASLKKLLAQKPLSKITIADITEDCGMNRMTFYYHFQDISSTGSVRRRGSGPSKGGRAITPGRRGSLPCATR